MLLAECLFFAASLRSAVTAPETASLLTALDALAAGGRDAAALSADSRALATLFAALAALDAAKLGAAGCETLRTGVHFAGDRRDGLTALLRLALGLCSERHDEPLLQLACDDGAFAFLLQVVRAAGFQVRKAAARCHCAARARTR